VTQVGPSGFQFHGRNFQAVFGAASNFANVRAVFQQVVKDEFFFQRLILAAAIEQAAVKFSEVGVEQLQNKRLQRLFTDQRPQVISSIRNRQQELL